MLRDVLMERCRFISVCADDTEVLDSQNSVSPKGLVAYTVPATVRIISNDSFEATAIIKGKNWEGEVRTVALLESEDQKSVLYREVRKRPFGIEEDDEFTIGLTVTIK